MWELICIRPMSTEFPRPMSQADHSIASAITVEDLRQVVASGPADIPGGVREAAKFFLVSPVARQLARGSGESGAPVGMTRVGLQRALELGSRENLEPGCVWELLAHEGGHAIFQLSGLMTRTANDVAADRLTPHIDDIINEAFAGAFGNRAQSVKAARY